MNPRLRSRSFLPVLLLASAALGLGGCGTGSLFVAKSESQPGDGKVPVSATVSANAAGNTADSSNVGYNVGGAVTFGATGPMSKRAKAVAALKSLGFTPVAVPVAVPPAAPRSTLVQFFAPPSPTPTPPAAP